MSEHNLNGWRYESVMKTLLEQRNQRYTVLQEREAELLLEHMRVVQTIHEEQVLRVQEESDKSIAECEETLNDIVEAVCDALRGVTKYNEYRTKLMEAIGCDYTGNALVSQTPSPTSSDGQNGSRTSTICERCQKPISGTEPSPSLFTAEEKSTVN